MNRPAALLIVAAAASSASAVSYPGNPSDFYLTSDTSSEVYQYERNSPWSYVPGTYTGSAKPMVFSNNVQTQFNALYLGAVAGPNQNFFLGGFAGLVEIDSTTGAFVQQIGSGGGARLGPAQAPNGNIAVGGPTGIDEFNSTTGAYVRTINNYTGNGYSMLTFSGDTMYASTWGSGGASTIKQYSFTTGLGTGPDIAVPFTPQEIAIGPDGALYASALYNAPYEGVYRYDGSSWSVFADTTPLAGTGPHGFAWDPVNFDLYLAMQTGEIQRFNGTTGAYLNQIDAIPTKLTDVLFKRTVPAPASCSLLVLAGAAAARRRR